MLQLEMNSQDNYFFITKSRFHDEIAVNFLSFQRNDGTKDPMEYAHLQASMSTKICVTAE
jgi:hypothetical protein